MAHYRVKPYDWWQRQVHSAHWKVNSGVRNLWPFLAGMYITFCFAQNLAGLIVHEPLPLNHGVLEFSWFVWVVVEPACVGLMLLAALRVPRHSLLADCAFLLCVYMDCIVDFVYSADDARFFFRFEVPAKPVLLHVMWYYVVVSMFVFAGFHFIPIFLFWAATVVFLLVGYKGQYAGDFGLAILGAVGFGAVIAGIAALIERHIARHSEIAERHRNAEHVLLQHATNGTCVVESQRGTLIHASPQLEQVLGIATLDRLSLKDLVIPEDKGRVQLLFQDANNNRLGATVVTLLLKDASRSGRSAGCLQDVRLIAYSASRSEVMVCLQLLGEARPFGSAALTKTASHDTLVMEEQDVLSQSEICTANFEPCTTQLNTRLIPSANALGAELDTRARQALNSPVGQSSGAIARVDRTSPSPPLQADFVSRWTLSPLATLRDQHGEPLADGEVSPSGSQAGSTSQFTAPLGTAGYRTGMLTNAVSLLPRSHGPSSTSSQGTAPLPWVEVGQTRVHVRSPLETNRSSLSPLSAPLVARDFSA